MSISEKPESSSGPPSQERWHVHKSGQVVTDDGDIIAIPSNERAASRAYLIADAPETARRYDNLLEVMQAVAREIGERGQPRLPISSGVAAAVRSVLRECEE